MPRKFPFLLAGCFALLSACASSPPIPSVVGSATESAEPSTSELAQTQAVPPADAADGYRAFREQNRAGDLAIARTRNADARLPTARNQQSTGTLDIHFIDVGQGDSTLIVCPNGKTILIDIGSKGGGEPESIRDYIWEQLDPDSPRLDTLVITHADGDHFNLIPFALDGVDVRGVVRVGDYAHFSKMGMPAEYDIQEWLKSVRDITRKLGPNDFDAPGAPSKRFDCGEADVYVLAADVRDTSDWWKNTRSIVLKVTFGEFDAILTGDATFLTENAILDRYQQDFLHSELLKVGHHGSRTTSTSDAWAAAVRPMVAIASSGEENKFGHPSLDVVRRLESYLSPWSAHPMISGSGKKGAYRWHASNDYTKAMFNTASSGTIVVSASRDGSFDIYQFSYE